MKKFRILSLMVALVSVLMITGCAKDAKEASSDIYGTWELNFTEADLADEAALLKYMANEDEAEIITMALMLKAFGYDGPIITVTFEKDQVTYIMGKDDPEDPETPDPATYKQDGNKWIVTNNGDPMGFTVNGNKMVCDMYPDFVFKRK